LAVGLYIYILYMTQPSNNPSKGLVEINLKKSSFKTYYFVLLQKQTAYPFKLGLDNRNHNPLQALIIFKTVLLAVVHQNKTVGHCRGFIM